MTAAPRLTLAEGYELASALVHTLARDRGIRLLTIKGPHLHEYGLRAKRRSTDLDLLVDPERFDELFDALSDMGWKALSTINRSQPNRGKSRTFLHPNWPLSIDLHRYYPGFLAPVEVVFDAFWEERQEITQGHAECSIAGRNGSALILAAHALRSSRSQKRHDRELTFLTNEAIFGEDDVAWLGQLARRTGSVLSLAPLLAAHDAEVEPGTWDSPGHELHDWNLIVASGSARARLRSRLRGLPWKERATVLWRSFWLPHDVIESMGTRRSDGFIGSLRFRIHRVLILLTLRKRRNKKID